MIRAAWYSRGRLTMVGKKYGIIIETATEARQAEAGVSILLLLLLSTPNQRIG
jgi:hypothetical protein